MTIEHKTTHGPTTPGRRAADWTIGSGFPTGFLSAQDAIRLEVPARDFDLTPASAAALRDALTDHLENIGSPTEALATAGPVVYIQRGQGLGVEAAEAIAHAIRDSRGQRIQPPRGPWTLNPNAPGPDVYVAQDVADAYADNARTIGAADTAGMTDAEAREIMFTVKPSPALGGPWADKDGILYTDAAIRELKVKAERPAVRAERTPTDAQLGRLSADIMAATEEDTLASPVVKVGGMIYTKRVRGWTDAQARGAWNHAMEAGGTSERLTDRPSGRQYTLLASRELRERLNKINAAPVAVHGLTENHNADPVCKCGWNPADYQTKIADREDGRRLVRNHVANQSD